MEEIWKPIKDYENLYEVSNLGRIKSLEKFVNKGKCHRGWKEHYAKQAVDGCGYLRTNLSKNGKPKTVKVHRMVAETFIPNPNNLPQVNHKDGNKQNNCVDNLEWCTNSENIKHAYQMGLKRADASNNPAHKLSIEDVEYIRKNYKRRDKEFSTIALAKKYNVHRRTIGRIVNMKSWKGVM